MTQQPTQPDKLESFKKEVDYLRSLALLPVNITVSAIRAAREKLKLMSDEEIKKARQTEDERIQEADDYWDKVEDDEIWTGL